MIKKQKYTQDDRPISWILEELKNGGIAIPEIQRPFVWDNERVRKLIESLYRGYPVGYLVTSKASGVKLKDGSTSAFQTLIMDGQQRITALSAALLGNEVVNSDYSKRRIKIAFNPLTEEFKPWDSAISRNKDFIEDISILFGENASKTIREYGKIHSDLDPYECIEKFDPLTAIVNRNIGVIELSADLDMEDVTEIFNRINSQGVPLKEVDFVMSKIAANENYGGNRIGKAIHHFAELVVKPEMYEDIKKNDAIFSQTNYMEKMTWLRNENDDIYDPKYEDILRVILTFKFQRGKMGDLVQLLSGRNFATRSYEDSVIADTYNRLESGLCAFINETNFKNFVMIVSSAGFCRGSMIRSTGALNFCYALYLYLRSLDWSSEQPQKIIRRWLVMSLLTGRYSSSAETRYENDIKRVMEIGAEKCLEELERLELSDSFWTDRLENNLVTSGMGSASFLVFLAAQCKRNARGFLSKHITVKDMLLEKGDIHHIFPKQFLKNNGLRQKDYNQVANYAYVETGTNIKIGMKSPADYFSYIANEQCNGGKLMYGEITDIEDLKANMKENCVPFGLDNMEFVDYTEFCKQRRRLITEYIKEYYFSL